MNPASNNALPPRTQPVTSISGATPSGPPAPGTVAGKETLADEMRYLEAAQRALRDGNGARALAWLDEHKSRFPNGVLAEERLAARVLALCRVGRSADARREAEAFVRIAPHSPLLVQVIESCVSEVAPPGLPR